MVNSEQLGFREKLSYRYDNFMAAGARSIFLTLIVMFLSAFVLTSTVRLIIINSTPAAEFKDKKKPGSNDGLWSNFMQIIDAGAIAEDNDSPMVLKGVGMLSVFFGLIFFSAVIAFITTQLDMKIASLKKGRSRVLEKDHTLILGWSDRVPEIIRELIIANESVKRACIVVMSKMPKEAMDDFFNEHIKDRKTTRIITRTGVTSSLDALERVGVTECKAVIILPSCNEAALAEEKVNSDAKTLKTLLAVVAASHEDKTKAHVVTEVFDQNNRELMVNLAPDNITMVNTGDMVAKMIVQTSRSSGLAAVYSSLIGFEGCEFYFHKADWGSEKFGALAFHFSDGIPFGIRDAAGVITLNPGYEYVMKNDDEVIILSEDDSALRFSKKPLYQARPFAPGTKRLDKFLEKELIIGWNSKGKIIIEEYTDYILENSVIDVVLPPNAGEEDEEIRQLIAMNPQHRISIIHANPLAPHELERLHPETYNNVIILNKVEEDLEKVDSTTITILLTLRNLFRKTEKQTGHRVRTQIISEVMNSENLELISKTGVNDFIISNQMISKIFSQISENPDILKVYEDLFREEGSEIYLKPLALYFETIPEEPVSFADLMGMAWKRNEICLGYRQSSHALNVQENFGIVLDPPKDMQFALNPTDSLIVLAEDER